MTGSSPAPILGESLNSKDTYPNSQTLNPGPVSWAAAAAGRPTLTGGLTAGRIAGERFVSPLSRRGVLLLMTDETSSRRKSMPGDASVRRSIQDLILSIDRNVKIDPRSKTFLLLDIANEFIDSVTNFGCRLAKHRGGNMLEVRESQPQLKRNHNIRIPGFASDLTPIALSQTGVEPAPQGTQGTKKGVRGAQNSHRAHRLAQVAQAKREAKLM
ncbi:transcription initiation factor TFIID subunit A-domain-containing protein [Lactarius vividus]|nr:transcription initiation factor TFIID subunit A-domain-containing protein [Lactarius vividus]